MARLRGTAFLNLKLAAGIGCGEAQPDLATPAGERAARAGGYLEALRHLESLSRASIRDNKLDETEFALAGAGEPELSETLTP